ncbi:hypothetical protein EVAR_80727_1 [Eumeta japonica]|uniref:Uncharacterized protein n=1 Tax=Eumeta variegata TaxID=151549 RepID=A0A4C1U3R8_EUMVA|nr:hypothetical protein EVAR_80727_1 [Eumeta japonica]
MGLFDRCSTTLMEYRPRVTVSAIAFRPVSESFGDAPPPSPHNLPLSAPSLFCQPSPFSIRPSCGQPDSEPARPIKYTLTEYRRKITVSAIVFRSVSESHDGPLLFRHPPHSPLSIPPPPNILFPLDLPPEERTYHIILQVNPDSAPKSDVSYGLVLAPVSHPASTPVPFSFLISTRLSILLPVAICLFQFRYWSQFRSGRCRIISLNIMHESGLEIKKNEPEIKQKRAVVAMSQGHK